MTYESKQGGTVVPPLKWVGGKRQLLSALMAHVPPSFGRYFEPFVGGGALFFALGARNASLSDTNERLIRTYRALRDDVTGVIEELKTYPHDRDFFNSMRSMSIDLEHSDAKVAAWMIYLNRTCFNGLYRVNKSGRFNVPFGRYAKPTICDPDRLLACSLALANATLQVADFEESSKAAKAGDLVYFDPPYVPTSATASFTSYCPGGFDAAAQGRLRDVARGLVARGVHVILSNSDTPRVRELYSDGFVLHQAQATRRVNSKAGARGVVGELIIVGEVSVAAAQVGMGMFKRCE